MTVLETERKNLKTLSDEELVKAPPNGDNEALEAILSRYKNLVYAKSNPYFLYDIINVQVRYLFD